MAQWFPEVSHPRALIGSVVTLLAFLPKVLTRPGIRLLDTPIFQKIIIVSTTEFVPVSGLGFLVLFLYFSASYGFAELSGNRSQTVATICGVGLGLGYALFSLSIWINPINAFFIVVKFIELMKIFVLNSLLTYVFEPAFLVEMQSTTRSTVYKATTLFRRSPGRPVRWPFYLFVAFVTVTAISDTTGWLETASKLNSFVVRLVCATVALTYGLIFIHNFFPGVSTLPWQSKTIGIWLLFHTIISATTLWSIRPLTDPEGRPSLSSALVIFLLIGVMIAVLDGLYPLPELLFLGGAALTMIERKSGLVDSPFLEPRALDIESRIINTISSAWVDSSRIFRLLVVFEGFFISCWLIWMLLFSAGAPLAKGNDLNILSTVVVLLVFSPLLTAGCYMLWFWIGEIQGLYESNFIHGRYFSRPPDLLIFPTLTIGGFMFGGLLAILCVLGGFAAMIWSVYRLRHRVTLPDFLTDRVVPVGFLIQVGGLQLAYTISPSSYGLEGTRNIFLIFTLLPLYLYPRVRRRGIGRVSPYLASTGLVLTVLLVSIVYLMKTAFLPILTSSVLGVAAIGLAVTRVLTETLARVQ